MSRFEPAAGVPVGINVITWAVLDMLDKNLGITVLLVGPDAAEGCKDFVLWPVQPLTADVAFPMQEAGQTGLRILAPYGGQNVSLAEPPFGVSASLR